MANFDLSNYVEVNVRVEKFWSMYPSGRIITEIVSFENGTIVMKANVFKTPEDLRPSATGHAYEKENSTFINKTSAVENCETSAVGRALGIMGFEIKKAIASKEEVANAIHQQNTIPAKSEIELKKELVKKHNGNKEAAKKEYEQIKSDELSKKQKELSGQQEQLDTETEDYFKEKFDMKETA